MHDPPLYFPGPEKNHRYSESTSPPLNLYFLATPHVPGPQHKWDTVALEKPGFCWQERHEGDKGTKIISGRIVREDLTRSRG